MELLKPVARQVVEVLQAATKPRRLDRMREIVGQRYGCVHLVLENLCNPRNVAACLRTADAMGVQNVHVVEQVNNYAHFDAEMGPDLGAYNWLTINHWQTPHKLHRFLLEQEPAAFLAVGAFGEGTVPVREAFGDWKERVLCSGETREAEESDRERRRMKIPILAVVLGNEQRGASRFFERRADVRFSIPQRGFSQSLNVSVACGVALNEALAGLPEATGDPRLGLEAWEQECLVAQWLMRSVPHAKRILRRHQVDLEWL